MGKRVFISKSDLVSVTSQEYKTLHATLDEYLRTGVLDTPSVDSSYDFNSAEEVDFNKPVPTDVDLYDAAAGKADPFIGITPLTDSSAPADDSGSNNDSANE